MTLVTDPFNVHEIMQPIAPVFNNSKESTSGASRIIPIKVERGSGGAFNSQTAPSQEIPVVINNLDELRNHQQVNKTEEAIRGYSKPVKVNVH